MKLDRPNNIRLTLAIIVIAVLAALFWSSSRYPALNEKALMSGAIELEDPLSFEAHLPVQNLNSTVKKILFSTVNWLETNRIGMTFGMLFAAAFLTLLSYLKEKSFKGSFANALLGLGMGAPLGVCVNCAAPIARGLYAGGARVETSLATMIASPTMNVVVLTMLFSLFPFYLAVAKVVLSLLVILVVVPLIGRWLPAPQQQLAQPETLVCELPVYKAQQPHSAHFLASVLGFCKDYLQNLWFVVRKTLPLMLLAGFLGALVATLAPPDLLLNRAFALPTLILVALAGLFAPVPIGFDVVLSAVLLNNGLDIAYVMTLLFVLGVFSVYSYFIVASAVSFRAAHLLALSILIIGVAAGLSAQAYNQWQTERAIGILTATAPTTEPTPAKTESARQSATTAGNKEATRSENSDALVSIQSTPFEPKRSAPQHATPFTALEAHHIGIDRPIEFSFADMWPPFWEGRSISSGDFDQDGDIDLAMASTEVGLYLYSNDGNGTFTQTQIQGSKVIARLPVFNAVLVDINNDSWLDLFLSTYQQGNYWVRNNKGSFEFDSLLPVQNRPDAIMTMALAFADIDKDGDLDAALGNWAAGWYRRVPGEEARNRIVINNGAFDGSDYQDLQGMPGETLSILFSDLNDDGNTDLLVANDFEQPDIFYYGNGDKTFSPVTAASKRIPHSTTTSMSVKTADLFNNGSVAIYLAQIAGRASGVSERLKMQAINEYCNTVERDSDRALCQQNIDVKNWYRSGNSFDPANASRCNQLTGNAQLECRGMLIKDLAIQKNDASLCELIPKDQLKARQYCAIHFKPSPRYTEAQRAQHIPQIKGRNVLLVPDNAQGFQDQAIATQLDVGGWSWDVKIADFDNDEWQDVYIVNGTWVPNEVSPSNLFYRNGGNGVFTEASGEFGLEDYHMTAAATQADIDGDGDLDLITMPVNAPPKAFINNNKTGNSVVLQFNDEIGNYYGIGAIVTAHYGAENVFQQTRELQLGGGFMSFDAPQVHFGLGPHESINRLSVKWADGSFTSLEQAMPAGHLYTVVRQRRSEQ